MNTEMLESDPGTGDDDSLVTDLTGQVLAERYRLLERIGEGGMGTIYRAEHVHMRKTLAVKVLHPELTTVDEVVQRFEREAQAAANIEHPNVCAATDFGRAETGEFYLVMEYVEGRSLAEVLAEEALPLPRALKIGSQICAALARAHEMGIIHRDLKPENVLLTEGEDGEDFVKVLDFGIARVPVPKDSPESQTLTRAGYVMGTPAYLSPEQASGGEVDHRADLYSFGVVLFEMLTGRRPFESPSTVELIGMHVTRPAPPLSRAAPAEVRYPRALEQLVSRLLAKEARKRPENAKVVREELSAIGEKLNLQLSHDNVKQIAREAASRAAETFQTMRNRVSPVLKEVKAAAPDAVPLLKRLPRWLWGTIAVNGVVALLALVGVWSTLFDEAPSAQEPAPDAGLEGPAEVEPGDQLPTKEPEPSPLERLKAHPDVAAALAKGKTEGPEAVARELGALYREKNSPELAYLLAKAEADAGEERSALLHARAAMLGDSAFVRDKGMRDYVLEVFATGQNMRTAMNIIEGHYLPAAVPQLQDLACSDPPQKGRRRAQALLRKTKSLDQLEPFCKHVIAIELRRGYCSDRLEAVQQLGELGDRRALPALRALQDKVPRGRSRRGGAYSCLAKELPGVIKALEKAPR